MKAICLLILSFCFCFIANAAFNKAGGKKVQTAVFNKKEGESKLPSFQIIANTNIVATHASNRLLGDAKIFQNTAGFKRATTGFDNNCTTAACLLKAYLSHIYPTHTSW